MCSPSGPAPQPTSAGGNAANPLTKSPTHLKPNPQTEPTASPTRQLSPHVRQLLLIARNHEVSASAIDAFRRASRRGPKVWIAPSYIANATGCAVSTARRARDRVARLLGLKFDARGWTHLSPWHWDTVHEAIAAMDDEDLTPELPGELQREEYPVELPAGCSMHCPCHPDRHPSAWFTWDATEGHGGAVCLAEGCGARLALRPGPAPGSILAIRQRQPAAQPAQSGPLTREGGGARREEPETPRVDPGPWTRGRTHYLRTVRDAGGTLRRGGLNLHGAVHWHGRRAGEPDVELLPNVDAPSQFVSVGIGRASAWTERRGGFPAPVAFTSTHTRWIPFDIDGHAPQEGPVAPDALERLAAAVPGCERAVVVRSSPTGSWVLLEWTGPVRWSDLDLDWLRQTGERLRDVLGWGGRVDPAVWHPGAMVRLPGWRTLHKGPIAGHGWLVRWYGLGPTPRREKMSRPSRAELRTACPAARELLQRNERERRARHPLEFHECERLTRALGVTPTSSGTVLRWDIGEGWSLEQNAGDRHVRFLLDGRRKFTTLTRRCPVQDRIAVAAWRILLDLRIFRPEPSQAPW